MELSKMGQRAADAKYRLQNLSAEQRNDALYSAAERLETKSAKIVSANGIDMENGKKKGLPEGLLDRLLLTEDRIHGMSEGLRQIAGLPDILWECMDTIERPNGLRIKKIRVPLGVIGIIYESRPNVTADAFGLCFKTGNAVLLKGGSDALQCNLAIAACIREALEKNGITGDCIQVIADTRREVTEQFMKLNDYVDVLIPRGSAGLIRSVVEHATIPVIETGTGNCHIYVDRAADLKKALPIILNAKTQRIGVCNACESLVIHRDVLERFLPQLEQAFRETGVEMRGDQAACEYAPACVPAAEEDYATEYLDKIISIKTVDSLQEAIHHINRCGTGHSESIITEDAKAAEIFFREVDAACVYSNASTRFTDGFEFGFGAEIGISTQKLHARGPMGLKEMTSYKYVIEGNGQIREL